MNKLIRASTLTAFLFAVLFFISGSWLSVYPAVICGVGCAFLNIKVDFFGFASTQISWYISVLNVNTGFSKSRNTYNLLFLSHDPIGWRIEILFISLSDAYDRKYKEYKELISQNGKEKFSKRAKRSLK